VKLHHVSISVSDLDRSAQFYEKLGLTEEKRYEKPDADARSSLLRFPDGPMLELFEIPGSESLPQKRRDPVEDLATKGTKHLALESTDLDRTVEKLRSRDVEVSEPKMGSSGNWYCFLKDPDGIPVELYEANG